MRLRCEASSTRCVLTTARFTAENATSAPKLISEARVARSITNASNENAETSRMANTGVPKRGDR
ncbi:hypothetical protein D3C85_1460080 [compost metagenome]